MEKKIEDIKPYIYERSKDNGFNFYKYLHIRGGAGVNPTRKKYRYGGEYDFIVYYASPTEMEGHNGTCERIWCEEMNIVYGEGKTIEEAYLDYVAKYSRAIDSTQTK